MKKKPKFDKRFNLSFSSQYIVFTLKHFFNNNTYIIKCSFLYFNSVIKIKAYIFFKLNKNIHIIFGIEDLGFKIK